MSDKARSLNLQTSSTVITPFETFQQEDRAKRFQRSSQQIFAFMDLLFRLSPPVTDLEVIREIILSVIPPAKCRLQEFNEFIDEIYPQALEQHKKFQHLKAILGSNSISSPKPKQTINQIIHKG